MDEKVPRKCVDYGTDDNPRYVLHIETYDAKGTKVVKEKYHIESYPHTRTFPRVDASGYDAAITVNESGGVRCLLLCSAKHAPMIKRALEAQAELEEFKNTFGNVDVYEAGFVGDLFKEHVKVVAEGPEVVLPLHKGKNGKLGMDTPIEWPIGWKEARMTLQELKEGILEEVTEALEGIAEQAVRPSVLYRPELTRYADGVKVLAKYGAFQAVGDTAEEAMQAFDVLWCNGEGEKEEKPLSRLRIVRTQYPNIVECFNNIAAIEADDPISNTYDVSMREWNPDKLARIEYVLKGLSSQQRQSMCTKRKREYVKIAKHISSDWKMMYQLLCDFSDEQEASKKKKAGSTSSCPDCGFVTCRC